VDLDVEVPGHLSLEETHELASSFEHWVETELEEIVRVETHIEATPAVRDAQGREVTIYYEDVVERIREIVEAQPGVKECHNIRLRRVEGSLYASLHCICPRDMSMVEAHRCSSKVEGQLREELPQVAHFLVPVEPG
jgi:divalent metal cation (Fe/Co/Zn/Cd) transporter